MADQKLIMKCKDGSYGSLFDAVIEEDVKKVRTLLEMDDVSQEKKDYRKWLVNEKSWSDWRVLHQAAESGHYELAKLILEVGGDVDTLTDTNYTPLHLGKQILMKSKLVIWFKA